MKKKKSQKLDTAIIVALIGLTGTIVTALFASPLIKSLVEKTPAPPTASPSGPGSLVFQSDFESGQPSGFAFYGADWRTVHNKGNQALELSIAAPDGATVTFGPNDFADGAIEFRVNFQNLGGFLLNFRSEADVQTYSLYLSTATEEFQLGYGSKASGWEFEPFEGEGVRPFRFNTNVWYTVKLEASGDRFSVWVDGNKIMSGHDSRLMTGSMEFSLQDDGVVWIDDVKVWEY